MWQGNALAVASGAVHAINVAASQAMFSAAGWQMQPVQQHGPQVLKPGSAFYEQRMLVGAA